MRKKSTRTYTGAIQAAKKKWEDKYKEETRKEQTLAASSQFLCSMEAYPRPCFSNDKMLFPRKIKKVDIGLVCKETYPCQHDIVIFFEDGERTSRGADARTIVSSFWPYLTQSDKQHFNYIVKKEFPHLFEKK